MIDINEKLAPPLEEALRKSKYSSMDERLEALRLFDDEEKKEILAREKDVANRIIIANAFRFLALESGLDVMYTG